jgi:hypothetical protein
VLNRNEDDELAAAAPRGRRDICRLFMASFLASCLLFWWLASFLYRAILDLEDPVTDLSLGISILSVGLFFVGFAVPLSRRRGTLIPTETLDRCENLSYKLTALLFLPAMCLAVVALASAGKPYNQGGTVSFADQVIYYLQLFFGFMFLGISRFTQHAKRRVWIVIALIVIPRIVVSLHFGRAFLAQGIVPIVFIAIARSFVPLSPKRLFQIAMLGLFILFVPSITRGDGLFDSSEDSPGDVQPIVNWIAGGSSLSSDTGLYALGLKPPMFSTSGFAYAKSHPLCPDASMHTYFPRYRDGGRRQSSGHL